MTWACEAYGENEVGALCFFAGGPGERLCHSEDDCRTLMTGERQRVFHRINELAAAGDPDAQFLSEAFTRPEELLGGGGPGATPP